ncbi:MAG: hypothetical protein Q7K55_02470 [Candidatus Levybacteria bacterium]|nr:hypothetical protein [Candidatus Levybacteria bacterium]
MDSISHLEKEVLRILYGHYQKGGKKIKIPTSDIFKELGIIDGMDVGTLNDSRVVKLVSENSQECFEITTEGIRLMDNLRTSKTQRGSSRRQIPDRDLKMLWGRAGNRCSISTCREELVQEKTESDPHVVVGIHSHIVADSPDGPRGNYDLSLDQRHLYDNLILVCMKHSKIIDEQLDTYTVAELKRIKNEHETWVSERLSAPDDLIGKQGTPVPQKDTPVLDMESLRRSGGPTGQFILFTITNNSQTQKAIDIQWEIRGFDYSFRSPEDDRFSLQPNFNKEVTYRLDTEKLYQTEVEELSFVMEFKDIHGATYFTRRELKQVRVPSDAFFELQKGDTFYPVEQIIDMGIKSVSEPYSTGDNQKCDFEVNIGGQPQMVSIGISRTLLSTWGIGDDDEKIRSALAELGSRIVRRMVLKGKLEDYMFVTSNFPQDYQTGFEGYKKLRDSL